jgi:hypothetical protein
MAAAGFKPALEPPGKASAGKIACPAEQHSRNQIRDARLELYSLFIEPAESQLQPELAAPQAAKNLRYCNTEVKQ